LLGHLPEQACEEEGNEIFQDESNDRTQIQKRAKTVALDQSNHGGEPPY
jgi:hypothetical protein